MKICFLFLLRLFLLSERSCRLKYESWEKKKLKMQILWVIRWISGVSPVQWRSKFWRIHWMPPPPPINRKCDGKQVATYSNYWHFDFIFDRCFTVSKTPCVALHKMKFRPKWIFLLPMTNKNNPKKLVSKKKLKIHILYSAR